jgi:hypothetical protein
MLKQRAARKGRCTSERAPALLTGKLFDENGEPLYACWAKKGARRYRYFVSRKLIRGAQKTDDNGWRLPAEETEQAAVTATRQMLSDRVALASVLKSVGLGTPTIKQALAVVERKLKSVDGLGPLEDSRSTALSCGLKAYRSRSTLERCSLLKSQVAELTCA